MSQTVVENLSDGRKIVKKHIQVGVNERNRVIAAHVARGMAPQAARMLAPEITTVVRYDLEDAEGKVISTHTSLQHVRQTVGRVIQHAPKLTPKKSDPIYAKSASRK